MASILSQKHFRENLSLVDINDYNKLKSSLMITRDFSAIAITRLEEIVSVLMANSSIDEHHVWYSWTLESSYRASKLINSEIAVRIFTNYFESLKKRGFDVNASTTDGHKPLFFAAKHRCPFVVQALINAKADVNCKSGINEESSLHILAQGDFTDLARDCFDILVKNECDLNIRTRDYGVTDNKNITPIWQATVSTNIPYINALVNAKADVNLQENSNQITLLHYATDIKVVKTLVASRTDIFALYKGQTPYKHAKVNEAYWLRDQEKGDIMFRLREQCTMKAKFLEGEMRRYKTLLIDCFKTYIPVKVLANIVFEYVGCDEVDVEGERASKKQKLVIEEVS